MAGEITTPLLPCVDIDEMGEFYRMLGFEQTYRQTRPNPAIGMRREDIGLQFFGMPGFVPADSYGSCVVQVPDIGALFDSFAAGMRAKYGKLLVAGTPRMTRPRRRKNTGNLTGFLVVDPGGNWIRFFPMRATDAAGPTSKLRKAIDDAVVQADSRGEDAQAAKILDGTLRRTESSATTVDLVDALAYRAELAVRQGDPACADALLTRIAAIPLTGADRVALADALAGVAELRRILAAWRADQ